MASNTKTKGAKGSPVVTAPKPEAKVAKGGKTPMVNLEAASKDAPTAAEKKNPDAAGKFISRDQFDMGDGKGARRARVAEYQDLTFSLNDAPGRQFTDEELCANWQAQFPKAVTFTPFHVKGARRDFNMGRHSKTFTTERHGEQMVHAYVMVEGKKVRADRLPKPEPKAKPAPAPAAEATPAAPAKEPVKGVRVKRGKKAA